MSDIAEAASVLLTRGRGSPQVFVIRRSESLRFFGGFVAFPGGRVAKEDARLDPALDPRCAAAARELFEETGVLVARRTDDSFPQPGPELDRLRREMIDDRLAFGDVLRRLAVFPRSDDFLPAGHLVTPSFAAHRFDTAFFVVTVPPGQEPRVWPGELEGGWWETAQSALQRWSATGEPLLSPPTLSLLEAVAGWPIDLLPQKLAPLLARLATGALPPIFFAPGVQMIPLRTTGLPPSTHTNAYLVGQERTVLLDPGPADPDEQGRLIEVINAAQAGGRPLSAVILTHHHPDHVGAAALVAQRYRVPVWAHPWTAAALRGKVAVDRELHEEDRIDLGPGPDGAPDWHLQPVHTPGHAPGHLVFWEPRYRLLFAADMVSTLSSIIIAPPEGDLAVYLDSLRRLLAFDARLLLPSHGSPTVRVRATIEEAIAHRLRREQMLLAALNRTPQSAGELAAVLYKGLPEPLVRFAQLQVLAGLYKLEREGRAHRTGTAAAEGWCLSSGV